MRDGEEKMEVLIAGVRLGNQAAFSSLLNLYQPLILSQVSRYGGAIRPIDRDDMMQESALALYRAALRYDMAQSEVTFGSYARVCISNALVSVFRKAQAEAPGCYSLDEMREQGTLSQYIEVGQEDLSRRLIAHEEVTDLHNRAHSCLSAYEGSVFDWYIKGYTPAQIAAVLGRSEKSVENAVGRMQVKLRSLLN